MKVLSRFAFLCFLLQATSTFVAVAQQQDETSKRRRLRHLQQQQQHRNEALVGESVDPSMRRRVFVKYKKGKHDAQVLSIQSSHKNNGQAEMNFDFPELNSIVVTATEAEIKKLEADPDVETVTDDPKRYPHHVNNNSNPEARMDEIRKLIEDQVSDGEQTIPYGVDLVQAPLGLASWRDWKRRQGLCH